MEPGLRRVLDLKDTQCADCLRVLSWNNTDEEPSLYASEACKCEGGTRVYVLHREDAPYLSNVTVRHEGLVTMEEMKYMLEEPK